MFLWLYTNELVFEQCLVCLNHIARCSVFHGLAQDGIGIHFAHDHDVLIATLSDWKCTSLVCVHGLLRSIHPDVYVVMLSERFGKYLPCDCVYRSLVLLPLGRPYALLYVLHVALLCLI